MLKITYKDLLQDTIKHDLQSKIGDAKNRGVETFDGLNSIRCRVKCKW